MEQKTQNPSDKDDDIRSLIFSDNNETELVVSAFIQPPEPPDAFSGDRHSTLTSDLTTNVPSVDLYFSPREESSSAQPSNTTQGQHGSSLYTKRKYRIHLGTRPGFYQSELFTYDQSQWRHEQLINLLTQFRSNLEALRLKHFQFDILLTNAISTTEAWGLEPYASIIFESCTRVMVEGVAAIIGRVFRQDSIGIFDESDDYQEHPIGETFDNFYVHRFFAISRSHLSNDLSISNDDASKMMKAIRDKYRKLSGQFGKSRETIELHDFDNDYDSETGKSLEKVVNDVFKDRNLSYRIEESRAKSRLLNENEYDTAIKRADFELLATFIDTVRLHDTVYNWN